MVCKKLVLILALAALLVATQVAEAEAGLTRKEEDKVSERDGGADVDKKESSDVKKTIWIPSWP